MFEQYTIDRYNDSLLTEKKSLCINVYPLCLLLYKYKIKSLAILEIRTDAQYFPHISKHLTMANEISAKIHFLVVYDNNTLVYTNKLIP
jgi:hypothetical protein